MIGMPIGVKVAILFGFSIGVLGVLFMLTSMIMDEWKNPEKRLGNYGFIVTLIGSGVIGVVGLVGFGIALFE